MKHKNMRSLTTRYFLFHFIFAFSLHAIFNYALLSFNILTITNIPLFGKSVFMLSLRWLHVCALAQTCRACIQMCFMCLGVHVRVRVRVCVCGCGCERVETCTADETMQEDRWMTAERSRLMASKMKLHCC